MKPFTLKVHKSSKPDSYFEVVFADYKDFFHWLVIQDCDMKFEQPKADGELPTVLMYDAYLG